jgi:hypothetical protein
VQRVHSFNSEGHKCTLSYNTLQLVVTLLFWGVYNKKLLKCVFICVHLHIFHTKQSETHLMQGSNNFPKVYRPEGWHEVLSWRRPIVLLWTCHLALFALYTLLDKNPSVGNFLSPELEVTWCTVAIIIRVVLLSSYLSIHGFSLSSIHGCKSRVGNYQKWKTDLPLTIQSLNLSWVEAESLYRSILKDSRHNPGTLTRASNSIIIIINIKDWTLWSIPSPELQLLSPTFLWSSNCSPALWSVVVWFQRDSVLWHSLQV